MGRDQPGFLQPFEVLGLRRSSVFITPVRAALEAATYPEARRVNRERAGEGTSAQVYALRTKILEVDRWVRRANRRVVEVHTELSFARLVGHPLPESKHTWAGVHHRRRLLVDAGIDLPDDLR